MAQRILRPLNNRELFDEVFDLYKKHFWLFVGISAVMHVPYLISFYGSGRGITSNLSLVFMMIQACATVWAVSQCYLGENVTVLSAYGAAIAKVGAATITSLLVVVALYVGMILCIVPGVLIGLWSVFVAPVLMMENRAYYPAFARSRDLARGHIGRIFVLLCVVGLVCCVLWWPMFLHTRTIFVQTRHSYHRLIVPESNASPLWYVWCSVLSSVVDPIVPIATVLLYYDIRVRKEGFDIEMLARDLGSPNREVPAS